MYTSWAEFVADHGIAPAYAALDLTHGPVWLALTGARLDAPTALEWGLVDELA